LITKTRAILVVVELPSQL
jgi:hypothetical protein